MNFSKLKLAIARLTQNSLTRNTLWMLLAQGLRIVLQAGYFVIIARVLGPEQYGAFVGATSLIAILAPFASLGGGNLLSELLPAAYAEQVASDFEGECLTDVLRPLLGLTLPPSAVSLVPNERIRNPSALIFTFFLR